MSDYRRTVTQDVTRLMQDYQPKVARMPLDPDVVALLHQILDINGRIVAALCTAPIIGPPMQKEQVKT